MGRGRGKSKKLAVTTSQEDPEIGEEESLPASKRRGRPQKPMKDKPDEEVVEKLEEEEDEEEEEEEKDNVKPTVSSKEAKAPATVAENGKKRKKNPQAKEINDSVKEEKENGVETRSNIDKSTKSNGFRLKGSRRKSKPRRAAEAGVECK